MERIFIDREWCIAYIVLALDSILNSANKERTLNDLIEEIRTMFSIHTDENQINKLTNTILNRKEQMKIIVDTIK